MLVMLMVADFVMLAMPAMLAMRVFAACYSCVFKYDDVFASVGFVNVIEDQFLTGQFSAANEDFLQDETSSP